MDEEPKLMVYVKVCAQCGAEMSPIAGKALDNKWRIGCSKSCGHIEVIGEEFINKESN